MRALCVTAAALMLSSLAAGKTPAPAQDTPAPCLGIVLPSVQGVDGTATDVAAGVRDLFVSYLNGPALRAMVLEARLPAQAAIEARQ